jgi:hypothetical protein
VVTALLVAAGCRAARPVVPPAALGGLESAKDALAAYERGQEATRTLSALFRITLRRPDGAAETSRGALAIARPDRLRLQIFSLGFVTVFDYTVAGDRYRVRRPLAGKTEIGAVGERRAADPETAFDLRPLFLAPPGARPRVRDAGDSFVLAFERGEERHEITLRKSDATIADETIALGGEPWLQARYSDYRDAAGFPLPYRIDVDEPRRNLAIAIEVSRYERNEPLDDSVFRF